MIRRSRRRVPRHAPWWRVSRTARDAMRPVFPETPDLGQTKRKPLCTRRLQTLQQIFVQGHYPTHIGEQLDSIRKTAIAGDALLARLDALRLRFRLTPSDGRDDESERLEVLRIVCSEGLV